MFFDISSNCFTLKIYHLQLLFFSVFLCILSIEPNIMALWKELLGKVRMLKGNDTRCKHFVISWANMLCSHVDSVLKSRPASLIIEANVERESKLFDIANSFINLPMLIHKLAIRGSSGKCRFNLIYCRSNRCRHLMLWPLYH